MGALLGGWGCRVIAARGTEEAVAVINKVFGSDIHGRLRIKVKRTCKAQGIPHFGLHGLRRLRVREYRRGGVDVVVAAALLGHSPLVMMRLYDEASKEEKREAMQALWAKERSEPDSGTNAQVD